VWLTNHAIEAVAKRNIKLEEVKHLIESGDYKKSKEKQGWIYFDFPERDDNLICAAIINENAIIIKTIMVNWTLKGEQ